MKQAAHPLEANTADRDYFQRANKHGKATYRRAVEACTGNLPTWATRQRAGRKKQINEDAALEAGASDL